uniref:Pepsin inhibitor-3-like repeated domain-containing protein n=1 Tax=Parascaris univalens TaxID=6257 RepID=A0A915B709_PARUN
MEELSSEIASNRNRIFSLFFVSVSTASFYNFSDGSCVIMNGHLYVNGVDKGPLTPEQLQQLQAYNEEVRKWSAALQRSIEDSFPWNPKNPESRKFPWNPFGEGAPQAPNFGNNWPFGPNNNPFSYGNNLQIRGRRSAVPPFPNRPAFCNQ